jgi:hypothetical protein
MPLARISTTLLSFLISSASFSQMGFPEFGKFTAEEISLKQCAFDPEAEAVILLDKAVVNHDDEYQKKGWTGQISLYLFIIKINLNI